MIPNDNRAAARSRTAPSPPVAAIEIASSIQKWLSLYKPNAILGRDGKDTAAPYVEGRKDTAAQISEHHRISDTNRLHVTPHGGGQETGRDTVYLRREEKNTLEVNCDNEDTVRHSHNYNKKRRNRKRRERRRNKIDTDSRRCSGSESVNSSNSENDAPLKETSRRDKKVVTLNDLFTKVVDYDNYRLHDRSTRYDASVAKTLTRIQRRINIQISNIFSEEDRILVLNFFTGFRCACNTTVRHEVATVW